MGQRREDGSPKGQDASGVLVHDSRPAGTPKKLLAPQDFLGLALAVASATNGSSGQ